MKRTIITIVIVLAIVFGAYFLLHNRSVGNKSEKNQTVSTDIGLEVDGESATTTDNLYREKTFIGKSVEGRDIIAYHYGSGEDEILFVGGIHGGYEWNSSLVAYESADYFKANLNVIPANLKVTVIPVLNPDGLSKVIGTTTEKFSATDVVASESTQIAGRFNANNVDLNRNFDCDWQTEGKWQGKTVRGGSAAFSEPESRAVKEYVESRTLKAVVVWYSAAGGVFASSCHNAVLPETKKLTDIYAKASGYPPYNDFDFYEITGDMVNWLAKKEIPAISVLLTNHTDTEWTKNLAGMKAVLEHYAE